MPDWGYTINKDKSIDFDKNDRSLSKKILGKEPSFRICMACGSCGGTCSAAQFTDFSFRKTILLIQRGELAGLDKEISKCMFCGKCSLVCPRGVNIRHILSLLRVYHSN
jgi:heterodisulfide reductase subunit C